MATPSERLPFAAGRPALDVLRRGLLLSVALLLVACGGTGDTPAPDAAAPASQAAESVRQPDQAPVADHSDAASRGELALREQRLFLPAGNNAFEYFLAAIEAQPADERSRLALDDLLPYAALHVEQRLAAEDLGDAERVLGLMVRASADAPALPRLQSAAATLRARLASAVADASPTRPPPAQGNSAATTDPAAAAPPVAAPTNGTAPAQPAITAPAAPVPAPGPASEAPEQLSAPAEPAVTPTPIAAPRVPEVVYRPPLRYPAMAERRKLEGFVEIEFTIGADGSVSELEVLRSQPEGVFDREALAAMQRWRFAPSAVPMRARRTLEFKLTR
jgi:protein TonB